MQHWGTVTDTTYRNFERFGAELRLLPNLDLASNFDTISYISCEVTCRVICTLSLPLWWSLSMFYTRQQNELWVMVKKFLALAAGNRAIGQLYQLNSQNSEKSIYKTYCRIVHYVTKYILNALLHLGNHPTFSVPEVYLFSDLPSSLLLIDRVLVHQRRSWMTGWVPPRRRPRWTTGCCSSKRWEIQKNGKKSTRAAQKVIATCIYKWHLHSW